MRPLQSTVFPYIIADLQGIITISSYFTGASCYYAACFYGRTVSVLVVVLKWYDNNEADRTGDRGVGIYGISGSEWPR